MGAAETKAGHEEENIDGTSAAPWPQLDGVRPTTSPALDDDRRREDGEGRCGAKSNRCPESHIGYMLVSSREIMIYTYRSLNFVCDALNSSARLTAILSM